jgi:hypothetical protein
MQEETKHEKSANEFTPPPSASSREGREQVDAKNSTSNAKITKKDKKKDKKKEQYLDSWLIKSRRFDIYSFDGKTYSNVYWVVLFLALLAFIQATTLFSITKKYQQKDLYVFDQYQRLHIVKDGIPTFISKENQVSEYKILSLKEFEQMTDNKNKIALRNLFK